MALIYFFTRYCNLHFTGSIAQMCVYRLYKLTASLTRAFRQMFNESKKKRSHAGLH